MRLALAGILSLAATACTTIEANTAAPVDVAIRNVTVIDPGSGKVEAGRDVLIEGGTIVAVIPSGKDRREALRTINGEGQFVMPGLMDMHAHVGFRPVHQSTLKLLLANGVTGVRDMSSDCIEPGGIAMCIDELRETDAKIAAGELPGPRIVEFASAKVDSNRPKDASVMTKVYRPTNAEEADSTVAALGARGVDIIKTGDRFAPEPFRAMMASAKDLGLRVGGHIPPEFSVKDVAEMGITSVEHARDLPVDCSTYGATYRAAFMDVFAGRRASPPDRMEAPTNARDTFDEALCHEQIDAMKANGVYYVPTHLTREMDYRAGEAAYRGDARLQYIPTMQQKQWNRDLDRTAEATPEQVAVLADFFDLGLRTTGMAHDLGVRVMLGTDANDTMVFPGFSVHDELAHLVAAGLTPMEALQAATSVPALYLGETQTRGRIAAGALADLVLLSADPTKDIANSTSITGVIAGGRVFDRAALDTMLAEVRSWVEMANAS